ncbi:hypothetical protein DFH06DRAFT_653813 [Mycena polygramma]|nr:hypothetical protein DFH06DRAFT_653813 [Mycena polygramma]
MDVEQKGEDAEPRVTEPGAEAAAAKIWAIYVGEAEKYDKGLVESWRSDMDGMLIFAGLFSASLTAFLIESYKTLNPDSGDSTVQLLAQISQQLAASANGSTFVVPTPPAFTPSGPALVCNALWFISLGLSLSCALIATLLEQWARDFIHRSEIRSAPLIRARIFSFLYYGLKRFNMHAVVEIIPLLLHTALLFFLAGLVAFLIPVNTVMAAVAGVMLAILTAVYSFLTILPLHYLDSPYRTPLSGVYWRALQRLRLAWQGRHSFVDGKPGVHTPKQDETMLEAVFYRATEDSKERVARDSKALIWTMKSLSDELELEPFVEAIPTILWGPNGEQRLTYADDFRQLVFHPDVALYTRVKGLFDSCDTRVLSPELRQHRRIIALKALWAITTLFTSPLTRGPPILHSLAMEIYDSPPLPPNSPVARECFGSLNALIQWVNFHDAKPRLEKILQRLTTMRDKHIVIRNSELKPIMEFLTDFYSHMYSGGTETSVFIPTLIETLEKILIDTPYAIRCYYFYRASQSISSLYAFEVTLAIVQPPETIQLPRGTYKRLLHEIVSRQMNLYNGPNTEWMDTIVEKMLSDWSTQPAPGPVAALSGFVDYLNGRQSDNAVYHAIVHWNNSPGRLWESFAQSILEGPDEWKKHYESPPTLPELLMALWRCTIVGSLRPRPSVTSFQAVLAELARFGALTFTPSVLALLKFEYLWRWPEIGDPIFPTESAVPLEIHEHDGPGYIRQAVLEAKISHLAQFLESCAGPDPFPYKAVETLQHLGFWVVNGAVHETHQLRLANAIRDLFANPRCADLRLVLINRDLFDLYAGSPNHPQAAWLDNQDAREIIKLAFTTYAGELSIAPDPDPPGRARVQAIVAGFDSLHLDVEGTSAPDGLDNLISAYSVATNTEPRLGYVGF